MTAPDFYAENIIFENSFNLYVSEKEAADSLVDISQSDMPWTEKERPKKVMPVRPKEVGSTEVAKRAYRERAAAISFTETAKHAHLKNCTAIGKQDVLYGDQGASIYWEGGILSGAVDFIFGAMTLCVDRATIIANITDAAKGLKYITPFAYCEAADIVESGTLDTTYLLIGMILCLLGICAAYFGYTKKDIR